MSRSRQRPKRGNSPRDNVLVLGDTGIFAGPQGGAEPGASESGDLASREYGVPQADIPGGKTHLVNPQTQHRRPPGVHERGADEHKYHGVEPTEPDGYVTPPDASDDRRPSRPAPAPKEVHAVPVYQVEGPQGSKVRRRALPFNIRVHASTSAEVTRICDRDDNRVSVRLLNEDSTVDIRISHQEEELLTASAQGTGGAGAGALLWHGTNSYTQIETQEPLYALTTSASTALLSVIIVTEVPA